MNVAPGRTTVRSFLVIAVFLVSVVLPIGCGSSDDDAGNSSAQASGGAGSAESDAATSEITAVVDEIRERYNATDGKGYCQMLTAAGQAEIERTAQGSEFTFKAKDDCAGFATQALREVVPQGQELPRSKVRKVAVDGDQARVTIESGLAGQTDVPVTFRFVKRDGGWKLDDPVSAVSKSYQPPDSR